MKRGVLLICLAVGLAGCSKKDIHEPIFLTSFDVATKNATVAMNGDTIAIRVPRGVALDQIVPTFTTSHPDVVVTLGSDTLYSGITPMKLRRAGKLVLSQPGNSYRKEYSIKASDFTGLPKIYIKLASGNSVQSHSTMQDATFIFDGNGNFENFDRVEVKGQIRGRGNSTWSMPKKPYKIKLDNATGIFEQKAKKNWVLLANYADKTLLRNHLAFEMSRAMQMPYTPYSQFVELYLNGTHQGNYQLTDQIEIGQGRVIASSIIEMDMRATDNGAVEGVDYFRSNRCPQPWEIEDLGTGSVAQLKSDMNRAESILFGSNYTSETQGWRTVFDEATIIRWTLVNELFRNVDARQCSVYFYQIMPGGAFYKGPVWDFDLGGGNAGHANSCQETQGWYVFNEYLFARLRNDAKFNAKVKEVWKRYRDEIKSLIEGLDGDADKMQESIKYNFVLWPKFKDNDWYSVGNLPDNYDGQLEYLKNYLLKRFAWMDRQLQ